MKDQVNALKLFKKISMYIEISRFGIYTIHNDIAFRANIEGLDSGSMSIDRIDIPDNAWIDRVQDDEVIFVNSLGIETRVWAKRKDREKTIAWKEAITLSKNERFKLKWLIDACAKPDRPNIASIALHPKHGFVATDGHRLHAWRPEFATASHEETKTVSPNILYILKKPLKFQVTHDGIYAESMDGLSGFFPWLDLQYPDIDQVLNAFKDITEKMEVDNWDCRKDKEKLKGAVKINGSKGQQPIVFHLDRTEFTKEKIGHFFKAPNVGLNPKYLDRVAGDYFDVWETISEGPKYPVSFRSGDRQALVMPLR